jgi:outer membrane immunogenic protein
MRLFGVAISGAIALTISSAHVASAADLPTKAPAYAPVASYNWAGFYVGVDVGGGWAFSQTTFVDGSPGVPPGFVTNPIYSSGVLGGAYAGYNYQINRFVVGIDGDYARANLRGSETGAFPNGDFGSINDRIKWIATAAARLGYAVNNWMFFGKGGWAWSDFDYAGRTFSPVGVLLNNNTLPTTRNGWTVGTGVEWGFAAHWSAKLEYDYVSFGTAAETLPLMAVPSGVVTLHPRSIVASLNMVKLGAAYRL